MGKNIDILITGHSRTGTNYMAKLFGQLGLNVGHECIKSDGISSWLFANISSETGISNPFGPTRSSSYKFKYLVHNVRDPFVAIRSIISENRMHPGILDFRRKVIKKKLGIDIGEEKTVEDKAVASFLYWNELIYIQNPDIVVQVENAVDICKEFVENKIGKEIPEKFKNPSKLSNSRYRPPINWDKVSKENINKLDNWCEKYGYNKISDRI